VVCHAERLERVFERALANLHGRGRLARGERQLPLEDSTGVLWVGTDGRLAFRGSEGFKSRPRAGIFRRTDFGLAEDKYGWLWMATSNHVLRVNRDKLLQGALTEGDLREYGLADGLRGVEGVKRHQSVFGRDAAGRIWFSLNRGISVVDPARLTSSSARDRSRANDFSGWQGASIARARSHSRRRRGSLSATPA
jgi:hypothetical protein